MCVKLSGNPEKPAVDAFTAVRTRSQHLLQECWQLIDHCSRLPAKQRMALTWVANARRCFALAVAQNKPKSRPASISQCRQIICDAANRLRVCDTRIILRTELRFFLGRRVWRTHAS